MKLVALSACNSGQFSQLQLCPYSYTVCNDTGLGASDNITYVCLCQSGHLVTGNVSTQYFYSELCAAPTSPPSNSTSDSPSRGVVSFTTASNEELQSVLFALFGVAIGLGLLAIGVVALNLVLILKTPSEKTGAAAGSVNGSESSNAPDRPVAHASPLGTAFLGRPNTMELVFSLGGEGRRAPSTYSEPEDYTISAVALVTTQAPVDPADVTDPVAHALPLGTALLERPNTKELVFNLGSERPNVYAEPEDYTSSAVAIVTTHAPVHPADVTALGTAADGSSIEDNITVNAANAIQMPQPTQGQSSINVNFVAMDQPQDYSFA